MTKYRTINNIRYVDSDDTISPDSSDDGSMSKPYSLGGSLSEYFRRKQRGPGQERAEPVMGRRGIGYDPDGPSRSPSEPIKFISSSDGRQYGAKSSKDAAPDFIGSAMKSLNPIAIGANAVGGIMQGISSLQGQNLARDKWQAQMKAAQNAGLDTPEQLFASPNHGILRGGTITSVPRGGRGYMN